MAIAMEWTLELATKPDFAAAMGRITAWYEGAILDRPPVKFAAHNAFVQPVGAVSAEQLRRQWLDVDYQLDRFERSLAGQQFLGETFPVYWPNLGPDLFAAFYGCELIFGEVTSWSVPCVHEWDDLAKLRLDLNNPYLLKIEELTRRALERCAGRYMVGYTDLHPGLDCVAAWRDPQALAMDLLINPERVHQAMELATADFQSVYDRFDALLKAQRQLSVTWMGIPSFGKMHIPSCDFSTMISREQFAEFCLPALQAEVRPMTHNVFHLDGKGVARHLDAILEVPEIQAIQWVQGVGDDAPIMQWVELIKKIQAAGKSVVVDLLPEELEAFIAAVRPEGILLSMAAPPAMQADILKRVERW